MAPDIAMVSGSAQEIVKEVEIMDKPLTADKLEKALHSLPNEKLLGRDGCTKEFFVWGWAFIKPGLLSMGKIINESLITLIPKKDTAESIHNWRPISLLSTIYKIVTKALAMIPINWFRIRCRYITNLCSYYLKLHLLQ